MSNQYTHTFTVTIEFKGFKELNGLKLTIDINQHFIH